LRDADAQRNTPRLPSVTVL